MEFARLFAIRPALWDSDGIGDIRIRLNDATYYETGRMSSPASKSLPSWANDPTLKRGKTGGGVACGAIPFRFYMSHNVNYVNFATNQVFRRGKILPRPLWRVAGAIGPDRSPGCHMSFPAGSFPLIFTNPGQARWLARTDSSGLCLGAWPASRSCDASPLHAPQRVGSGNAWFGSPMQPFPQHPTRQAGATPASGFSDLHRETI